MPPLLFSNGVSYFDHRLYLPLVGCLIMIGEIDFVKDLDWRRREVISGSVIILLILSILTFSHSRNFRSPLIFWQSAVKGSPHSLPAHTILGGIYSENAKWPEAERELLAAIAIAPQEPILHYNLGVVYLNIGNKLEATLEFKKELTANPGYYKALANLGDLAYGSGRLPEAIGYWRAALASNPGDSESAKRLESLNEPLR